MPQSVPDRPWAKVGADLFELQGQHYLLLVHYYSNFFELARLDSNTRATCVIDAMRSQFACHGSPEMLVSDKGPQFSCREFRAFTQLWTSSMSRAALDTHTATDKLNEPSEP